MKNLLVALLILVGFNGISQKEFGDGLYAVFNTTKGEIIIQLEFEKVPMTVANFVGLVEGDLKYDTVEISEPFYDSLKFHRVIADFMIQGGCPLGNGTGNPGYKFYDEFDSTLMHDGPGILSMANSGPNTNGSQFFITHKETPWLNFKHSVFGRVVKGQEVVDAIEQGDMIFNIEIVRIGKKAKKFKAAKVFPAEVKKKEEAIAKELSERNGKFEKQMLALFPDAVQTSSGLMYQVLSDGNGTYPQLGQIVEAHYTGYYEDGTKFSSSFDGAGKPLKFMLAQNYVIEGWVEGIQLCQVSGEIKLIIPSWLGYGRNGKGPIPPNANLIFDVQVLSANDKK